MAKVYELLGFRPRRIYAYRTQKAERKLRLRHEITDAILDLFPGEATLDRPSKRKAEVVKFQSLGHMSIMLCRSGKESSGLRYWDMVTRPHERAFPTLVCLMSSRNNSVEKYYMVPNIDAIAKLRLTPEDRWFQRGLRLESLKEVKIALEEVLRWVPLGPIYRGVSNAMTQLMGPAHRQRCHDAERLTASHLRQP
ncbi:MAG: hypothetical protein L0387_42400 [Acidobacteria bacterium]|nr:hypothetical protein [Acidobacteriota bacterium]